MSDLSLYTISDDSTLLQAVEKIQRNESRAVLVVHGDVVTGVVSEGDVMRALLRGVNVLTPLSSIARRSFRYLRAHDEQAAFDLARKHFITIVPVVNDDFRLTGVITLVHLLQRARLHE